MIHENRKYLYKLHEFCFVLFFSHCMEVTSAFNEPWSCKSRVCVCMFALFSLCPFQINQRIHLLSIRNAGAYEKTVTGSVTKQFSLVFSVMINFKIKNIENLQNFNFNDHIFPLQKVKAKDVWCWGVEIGLSIQLLLHWHLLYVIFYVGIIIWPPA